MPINFLFYNWTDGGRTDANVEFLKSNMSNLENWYNQYLTHYNNPNSELHKKVRFMIEESNPNDRGNHGWKYTA